MKTSIEVEVQVTPRIAITNPIERVFMGDTHRFECAFWNESEKVLPEQEASWESSDNQMFTLDKEGSITPMGMGKAWVRIETMYRGNRYMDSVQVEVVAKEDVPPTGEASLQITSVPPENQLTEEGTFELEAEFTDRQGEVQQEQPISWAILEGNEFVELDSTTGKIRGLGEGTATVQATTIYEGKPVPSDVIVISVLPQQEQSTAKIEITNPPRS